MAVAIESGVEYCAMTRQCNSRYFQANDGARQRSPEARRQVPLFLQLLAICMALGCAAAARAQAPDQEDEALVQSTFIAEVFNIQERSEVQLTLGSSLFRGRGVQAGGGYIGMEYGFTDRLQAGCSVPFLGEYSTADEKQHIREINFGLSYGVRRQPRRFAIMPQLQFSREYGAETGAVVKVKPGVIVAQQWGATALHLGASRSINNAEFALSAALVQGWRNWRGTFEVSRESDGGQTRVQVAPGLIRTGRRRLRELGIGVPVGLRGDTPGWGIVTRITFEFSGEAGKR